MFKYVSDFYKKMGVDLDIRFVDAVDQSALKPAKHLAIEIYVEEKCVQRDCELAGTESKFDCTIRNRDFATTAGVAYIKKNIALACYFTLESLEDFSLNELEKRIDTVEKAIEKSMEEYIACRKGGAGAELEKLEKEEEKLTTEWLFINELIKDVDKKKPSDAKIRRKSEVIVHELGHLFGLYHSGEFINDPVPDYLSAKNRVPNYMIQGMNSNYSAEFPIGCGFNEFQKRIVHSYLGGGKVYRQLEAVNFIFHEYLKHIKEANDYKE